MSKEIGAKPPDKECDICGGLGYYAEPVHVCGGDEGICHARCPEAEQTHCPCTDPTRKAQEPETPEGV